MKISYMLVNQSGKARKIPPGQAWRWTYHVEDESELAMVFSSLKRDIRDNRLALANLVIERHKLEQENEQTVSFDYKGPIIYDESLRASRIINRHAHLSHDPSAAASR